MSASPSARIEPGAKVFFSDRHGVVVEGLLRGYCGGARYTRYAEIAHRDGPFVGCITIVPVACLRPCPSPAPSGRSAPVGRRVRRSGATG